MADFIKTACKHNIKTLAQLLLTIKSQIQPIQPVIMIKNTCANATHDPMADKTKKACKHDIKTLTQ